MSHPDTCRSLTLAHRLLLGRYAFHWGNILLDYRYLYYDQDDGELLDDLSFGGLALGVNFQF